MKQITFDTRGNDKQAEALRLWTDPKIRQFVFGGSKYCGKTYVGCSAIFGDALIYPETNYFIARNRLNDLRKYTRGTVSRVFQDWGLKEENYCKYDGKDDFYRLYNGSYVYFLEASYKPTDKDFTRFGSLNMTKGFIEEGGELTSKAVSNLTATVGRWNNDKYNLPPKVIITCNPTKNFLYNTFYKPFHDGTLEDFRAFIQALPTDNKTMSKDYYNLLLTTLSPSERQRLLYGKWEFAQDEDALITDYNFIENAFSNIFIRPVEKGGYISTDLALHGRDYWVTVHVTGSEAAGICFKIIDAKETAAANDIETKLRAYEARFDLKRRNVIADSDGLGQYLKDYMKGITAFHGGSRAHDPVTYQDLKSECGYFLARMINEGKVRIVAQDSTQAEVIKTELNYLKATTREVDTQRKKILSKDKIKPDLGHSPDFLDSLIMGCLPFVRPKFNGIRT